MKAILLFEVQIFKLLAGIVINLRFAGYVSAAMDIGIRFTNFFELDPPLDQVVLLFELNEGLKCFDHHVKSFLIHSH